MHKPSASLFVLASLLLLTLPIDSSAGQYPPGKGGVRTITGHPSGGVGGWPDPPIKARDLRKSNDGLMGHPSSGDGVRSGRVSESHVAGRGKGHSDPPISWWRSQGWTYPLMGLLQTFLDIFDDNLGRTEPPISAK